MSDLASWQDSNTQYLSAALAWLRACLEQRAGEARGSTALVVRQQPQEEPKPFWRHLVRRQPERSARPPGLLPAPRAPNHDEHVAKSAADLVAAGSQMEPPPTLMILGQRLGLSRFEQEVLLLCAATELDTDIAALCARAQGDPARTYPTFALALTLFDEPTWDALSPERPLRYWRLIEINQPGALPLTVSPLRADERVVNYLKGLNYLDDRLAPLLTPLELPSNAADLPPSQRDAVETIVLRLKHGIPNHGPALVQLVGVDAASKQLMAAHVGAQLGLQLYRSGVGLLPTQATEIETLARLWQRESLLSPVALYLDTQEPEGEGSQPGHAAVVKRLLDRIHGIIFLDTRDVWTGLGRQTLTVDVAKPSPAEQQAAWAAALGEKAGDSPALLAGQFNLNLGSLWETAHKVLLETPVVERPLHERLWDECLASARPRLETLAQRLEPKSSWDDIVLPPGESTLLRQIASQVGQRSTVYEAWGFRAKMSRGLGISALFAGESGTGKTMAAEILANHLRLNLYRIDLSAVVSKYIGETEKNLRRLFDAAEDGGAILFFDEADALFGKRSEVKDSHDRYANIEINYLLQRMETYRGLAILATNMKSALDAAFLRRLRFVVTFPFPGLAERRAIWQKVFPQSTPTAELDPDRLARFNLTGGHIHNIALNAAFLAAQAGTAVTMPWVLDAARTEFRKLERPINEADFRWQVAAGAVA